MTEKSLTKVLGAGPRSSWQIWGTCCPPGCRDMFWAWLPTGTSWLGWAGVDCTGPDKSGLDLAGLERPGPERTGPTSPLCTRHQATDNKQFTTQHTTHNTQHITGKQHKQSQDGSVASLPRIMGGDQAIFAPPPASIPVPKAARLEVPSSTEQGPNHAAFTPLRRRPQARP